VPHEGGRRFAVNSLAAQIFRAWLAEGVRDDPATLPALKSITVSPRTRVLHAPAHRQQLTVRALFADGRVQDVTRLTAFKSSDEAIAHINSTGLVEFEQSGEVAILCRYMDQMISVRLMYLRPRQGFRWPDPPENNYVDKHVFAKLKMLNIAPSELCNDQEFVRRAYLDVCGILPAVQETRAFLASSAKDKRGKLIDALLERPEYADFWTMKWADLLRVSKKAIQLLGAKAYHGWLCSQLAKDVPFDQVVRALLTSQGHSHTSPAANYYCVVPLPVDPKDIHYLQNDMAETTAQVFCGIRLQCAKCHNHPYERWTQDDYAGLAAFFTRVKQTRTGKPPSSASHLDLRTVSISLDAKAPEMIQPRTGKATAPKFLGGAEPKIAADADRRAVLAGWLTRRDNPFFARAVVNRIWFHLHGRGIVEPVDDFRDANPSVNDDLLDALAQDFVKKQFQFKHLLRVILNSRTYQLSSRTNAFNRHDTRYFSHLVPRPLPAEVLLDALCAVTAVPESYADFPVGTRAVQLPFGDVIIESVQYQKYEQHRFMRVFGQPARDLVCACARERRFDSSHSLEMMIGPTLTAKLRQPNNRLGQLLANPQKNSKPEVRRLSDAEILDELYLATLSRLPSRKAAQALLRHVARTVDRRKAWEDVLWTILRSKEFIYRH
jgi:hypothetical protein